MSVMILNKKLDNKLDDEYDENCKLIHIKLLNFLCRPSKDRKGHQHQAPKRI